MPPVVRPRLSLLVCLLLAVGFSPAVAGAATVSGTLVNMSGHGPTGSLTVDAWLVEDAQGMRTLLQVSPARLPEAGTRVTVSGRIHGDRLVVRTVSCAVRRECLKRPARKKCRAVGRKRGGAKRRKRICVRTRRSQRPAQRRVREQQVISGLRTAIVLPIRFTGDPEPQVTPAQLHDAIFGPVGSAARYWQIASREHLKITGTVYPRWIELPAEWARCTTEGIVSARPDGVREALYNLRVPLQEIVGAESGMKLADFHNVLFAAVGGKGCTYGGWGYGLGNRPFAETMGQETLAFVPPTGTDLEEFKSITMHEWGHNFDLHHTARALCTNPAGPVAISDTCTITEYGDPWDTMGTNRHAFGVYDLEGRSPRTDYLTNAAVRGRLGWLPHNGIRTVRESGIYRVRANQSGSGSLNFALRLPAADPQGLPAGCRDLMIEYRSGFGKGEDGGRFELIGRTHQVNMGVLVREVTSLHIGVDEKGGRTARRALPQDLGLTESCETTMLLDASPAAGDTPGLEALTVGKTFVDDRPGGSGAKVTVLRTRHRQWARLQIEMPNSPLPPAGGSALVSGPSGPVTGTPGQEPATPGNSLL